MPIKQELPIAGQDQVVESAEGLRKTLHSFHETDNGRKLGIDVPIAQRLKGDLSLLLPTPTKSFELKKQKLGDENLWSDYTSELENNVSAVLAMTPEARQPMEENRMLFSFTIGDFVYVYNEYDNEFVRYTADESGLFLAQGFAPNADGEVTAFGVLGYQPAEKNAAVEVVSYVVITPESAVLDYIQGTVLGELAVNAVSSSHSRAKGLEFAEKFRQAKQQTTEVMPKTTSRILDSRFPTIPIPPHLR